MSRLGGSNVSWLLLAGALAAVGCDSDSDDRGTVEVPVEGTDAGSGEDAASRGDAGSREHAAESDAGSRDDSGLLDSAREDAGKTSSEGHLVVVTERESPEDSLHYLHVLETWPEDGKLDYANAIELGAFPNVYALGDAVFVHLPEDGTVRKLVVKADGTIGEDTSISFAGQGANGVSGDMIWVSETRAYFLDEASAQFIAWNPQKMAVEGSFDLDSAVLKRGQLPAQISRGIARDGEGFVSVSWRDWDTLEYYDSAAIGVFDAKSLTPKLEVIEDDRCSSNVTTPFKGDDGFVYLMSDAALGFDSLANPKRTEKALCVLRIKPGANEFDKDFFVDLKQVLKSPGFYAAHPMKDGKLLVNMWAPDVEVESVATPDDPSWYWSFPPYFEYAIVDLKDKTSIPVRDLGRAAVQWSVTIRVDDETYVQTYREDKGSDLKRVDTDGSVTTVISNPRGTDVQYVGRVRR